MWNRASSNDDYSSENEDVSGSLEGIMTTGKLIGQELRDRRECLELTLASASSETKIPEASLRLLEVGDFSKLPGDVFVRGFLRSYSNCLGLDGDEFVDRYARIGLEPAPVSSHLAVTLLSNKTEKRRSRAATQAEALITKNSARKDSTGLFSRLPKEERGQSEDAQDASKVQDAFELTTSKRQEHCSGVSISSKKGKNTRNTQSKKKLSVGPETCKQESKTSSIQIKENKKPARVDCTEKRVRCFIPPRLEFDDPKSKRGPLTLGVIVLVIVATLTMSYLLKQPGTHVDGFTFALPSISTDNNVSSLILENHRKNIFRS